MSSLRIAGQARRGEGEFVAHGSPSPSPVSSSSISHCQAVFPGGVCTGGGVAPFGTPRIFRTFVVGTATKANVGAKYTASHVISAPGRTTTTTLSLLPWRLRVLPANRCQRWSVVTEQIDARILGGTLSRSASTQASIHCSTVI